MQTGRPYEVLGKKHIEKYGKETRIQFVGYDYKSNIGIKTMTQPYLMKDLGDRTLVNKEKHEQYLYMPTQKRILNIAKIMGFILIGKYDLSDINDDS